MRKLLLVFITILLAAATFDSEGRRRSQRDVRRDRNANREQIERTNREISANTAEVGRQLSRLQSLEATIALRTDSVAALQKVINNVKSRIAVLDDSIATLENATLRLKDDYGNTLRRMRTRRQSMSDLSFIFSAQTFGQAWRRIRYLRQTSAAIARRAHQIKDYQQQLAVARGNQATMLDSLNSTVATLNAATRRLDNERVAARDLVKNLRSHGRALERELQRRRQQAAALEAELQQVIEQELEEQRQREAEERRRREEAERQKREAEERRRQEEAERQRKQKEQQKEQQKQEKPSKPAKTEPQKPTEPTKPATQPQKPEKQPSTPAKSTAEEDIRLTGSFGSNKGKLPFPVTGPHTIVSHFGTNIHPDLPKVKVDNLGIDIEASRGASVRSVFEGVVSSIFRLDGYHNVVIIRHGEYLTVYAGLDTLSIRKGDKVRTGQTIGTIYCDTENDSRSLLHFEIRREKQKLNPAEWVK